ncbi:MAG: bifunctional serine/threonine-protein kinase/formylglycine-generating enzyme family protein [Sorangiineae bacterium]|nr:bifunctional serine/threonine-protein kinase/formylglycine-generating enzyme family protein [Polyangiaceae bacterium]MEB2324435.1 bifunctional serine/threonine-protein kinase/formylglycine-generating enzyme family protein [Sorangiineae bacterium]
MASYDPLELIGQTIADKYLIEELVGEGGFAVVYRAQHTIWGKPVAIKFFSGLSSAPVEQRGQLQQSFINEGALLTELSSQTANIVQARDIGTCTTPAGQWMPFMVLEWLDGASLDVLLEREHAAGTPPWSLDEVVRFLAPVAAALEIAHKRGIAHRDIKPANLFVLGGARSPGATVKLLDFGVAKMMTENTRVAAAIAKTGTSITSFTPQYGAPEQFSRSYGATGPWTDVFALALVAVELLSGGPALDGEDVVQLGFASGNPARRPSPRSHGAVLPDAVEAVFLKALAPNPPERYGSAREFWTALEEASGGASHFGNLDTMLAPSSASPSLVPSSSRSPSSAADAATLAAPGHERTGAPSTASVGTPLPPRRTGLWVTLAVLAAAAAGGAAVLVLRGSGTAPPPRNASAPSSATVAPSASAPPRPTCPEGMVAIPAGQFFMGSDARDARDDEKPPHNVKLDGFCLDLHEVTAREYKACSEIGKCRRAPSEVDWPNITEAQRKLFSPLCNIDAEARGDHPINCVPWSMADNYCKMHDKRLPTEAEWEYASRGPDGRVYPWGDEPPTAKHANACGAECVAWARAHRLDQEALYPEDDGYATTAPVGKFPKGKSRFGPFDMAGNVWEWTADWYGPYTSARQTNPKGPESGEQRVMRGGAFNGSDPSWLTPAYRFARGPELQSHGVGFRCAKSLEP